MTRPWAVGWVALVALLLGAGPPVVKSAVPAPELDALFQRTDGWIGGDGAIPSPCRPSERSGCSATPGPAKSGMAGAPTRRSSTTRSACRRGRAGTLPTPWPAGRTANRRP